VSSYAVSALLNSSDPTFCAPYRSKQIKPTDPTDPADPATDSTELTDPTNSTNRTNPTGPSLQIKGFPNEMAEYGPNGDTLLEPL
jgi:hypothetical protein